MSTEEDSGADVAKTETVPQQSAPKKAPPKSAQEALAALDEPPTQSWGWGSLWTSVSAVASVTANLANSAVDKVYEALSEEPEAGKPESSAPESSSKPQGEDDQVNSLLPSTEGILSTIDKTFDFASDALGNAVLTGFRALESAKVGQKVESIVGTTLDSSKVVLNGLVNEVEKIEGIKEAREAVVGSGLHMLEALGERVAGVIVDATGRKANPRRNSSSQVNSGEKDEGSENVETPQGPATSFATAFPQTSGPKALQKLQALASEASIRAKRLPTSPSATAMATAKEAEKILDPDAMMEAAEEGEPSDDSRKTLSGAAGRLEVNLEALVDAASSNVVGAENEEQALVLSRTYLALASLASVGVEVFLSLTTKNSWKERKCAEVAQDVRSLAVGILLELQGLAGRHAETVAKRYEDEAEAQTVSNEIYREAGVAMGAIQDAAVATGTLISSWALEQVAEQA